MLSNAIDSLRLSFLKYHSGISKSNPSYIIYFKTVVQVTLDEGVKTEVAEERERNKSAQFGQKKMDIIEQRLALYTGKPNG